jgi:nucleoside-diphosphate-sugar epimerase
MGKIALFGASGAIGHSVGEALRQRGQEFRVVARSAASLEREFGNNPHAERVTWNPDDPASVRAAARGIDTLIYLVGVPYDQFQLHPELMRKTLHGATAEGVQRLVLVGTVYPYGMPRTEPVKEDHPREPHTFKGKMRKAQEDLLLEADAVGKIRGTILRLPDFYGPFVDKSFLHDAFIAALTGRTANLIGPIDVRHQFVFVPDVGPVLLDLAARPEAYGRWWHFAGSSVATQRELANQIFAAVGRKPKLRVANKSMLRVLGLFNPLMRELVEMHYLQTNPVILDDSGLRGLLGTVHSTPYAEGIRRTLEAMRAEPHARAAA